MNKTMNNHTHAVMELFVGCGGMSTGFEMAGPNRDCCVIAGALTRRSVVRPGGFSDFSNIIRMIPKEQKGDR
jgi:hypothetical protein